MNISTLVCGILLGTGLGLNIAVLVYKASYPIIKQLDACEVMYGECEVTLTPKTKE